MEIIPAIDLREGRVVRLKQGDYAQETRYAPDPADLAEGYATAGACWLHLVDLDGARSGAFENLKTIAAIAKAGQLRVQAGGGVRNEDDVQRLFDAGVARIVVGSVAVREPEKVEKWIAIYGIEQICIALDTRFEAGQWRLPSAGWTQSEGATLDQLAPRYAAAGARHLLCTDISRDGMLSGPNLDLYVHLRHIAPQLDVIASGGIRDASDVRSLREQDLAGVVLGRSLLEGRLDSRRGLGMLTRRIIPCLDVRDGKVVKGVRFRDHVVIGDIVDLATRYRDAGADELVFYDITASPQGRSVDHDWVEKVARVIDIPFCVAGGIRSVEEARAVLHAGADKVSVNSPALERPELIDELADAFGVQCVVVGVDSLRDEDGEWRVRQYTGDPTKTRALARRTLSWVAEVQQRGAGEIVLNCMGADGVREGYDLEQLVAVRAICRVPLVASGGAGIVEHFRDVFAKADADAALAASVFHSGTIPIPDLKRYLRAENIAIRP